MSEERKTSLWMDSVPAISVLPSTDRLEDKNTSSFTERVFSNVDAPPTDKVFFRMDTP